MKLLLGRGRLDALPRGDRAYPITEPVQVALIRLLENTAVDGDLELVGLALNLTSARLQILRHKEGLELLGMAGQIVMAADDARPSLAQFPAAERQLVIDAVDLYVETMRTSSPNQMETAKQLAYKQMLAAIQAAKKGGPR